MPIQFTPALGKTTTIPVPITNDGVVRLRFVASINPDEYQQLEHRGIQVQLWSDLPAIGSGRSDGQWGELTFKREAEGDIKRATDFEGVAYFNTRLSSDGASEDISDAVRLTFETDIQLAGPSTLEVVGTWQFSFTYRLVSASGEVTWLGQFGNDGVLVLSSDPHCLPEHQRSPDEFGASEWLRLGQASKYSIAGISKSGSLIFSSGSGDVQDASMLLLVPQVDSRDILLSPALLLSASSPESGLYIRGNDYVLSVRPPLGLHTIETSLSKPGFRRSVQKILASSFSDTLRLANLQDDSSDMVILASAANVAPIQIVVIPPPGARQPIVSLTTQQLAALLPSEIGHFLIFCPSSAIADIYAFAHSVHTFEVSVNPGGAEILVTPAYSVPGSKQEADRLALIAFVTPHSFSAYEHAPGVLPTPPPSPKRALEVSLSTDTVSSSVYPPESDALSPSTSKSSEFSELATSISTASDLSSASATSSQSAVVAPSSNKSLIVYPLAMKRSRGMVVACMALFVHMAEVFIKSVFCRVFYLLFGSGATPVRQPETKAEESNKEKVDETTPLIPKETQPESSHPEYSEKQDIYHSHSTGDLPTIEEETSIADTPTSPVPTSPPSTTAPPRLVYLCIDVPAGKSTFIVKNLEAVSVVFNGQSVKVYSEGATSSPEQEKMQQFSFDMDLSGRVKICAA